MGAPVVLADGVHSPACVHVQPDLQRAQLGDGKLDGAGLRTDVNTSLYAHASAGEAVVMRCLAALAICFGLSWAGVGHAAALVATPETLVQQLKQLHSTLAEFRAVITK